MTIFRGIVLFAFAVLLGIGQPSFAEELPYATNLLSIHEVEKVTGLKGLVATGRDFKNGLPGDINIRRADDVLVVSLTVQQPDLYEQWRAYHEERAHDLYGLGEASFGRLIPLPVVEDDAGDSSKSSTKDKKKTKLFGPPQPPDFAAVYVKHGPVAFSLSRQPFESTLPPGVSRAQLTALTRLVIDKLDALVPAPTPEEKAASTGKSGAPRSW